jgi:hypothetical protein
MTVLTKTLALAGALTLAGACSTERDTSRPDTKETDTTITVKTPEGTEHLAGLASELIESRVATTGRGFYLVDHTRLEAPAALLEHDRAYVPDFGAELTVEVRVVDDTNRVIEANDGFVGNYGWNDDFTQVRLEYRGIDADVEIDAPVDRETRKAYVGALLYHVAAGESLDRFFVPLLPGERPYSGKKKLGLWIKDKAGAWVQKECKDPPERTKLIKAAIAGGAAGAAWVVSKKGYDILTGLLDAADQQAAERAARTACQSQAALDICADNCEAKGEVCDRVEPSVWFSLRHGKWAFTCKSFCKKQCDDMAIDQKEEEHCPDEESDDGDPACGCKTIPKDECAEGEDYQDGCEATCIERHDEEIAEPEDVVECVSEGVEFEYGNSCGSCTEGTVTTTDEHGCETTTTTQCESCEDDET